MPPHIFIYCDNMPNSLTHFVLIDCYAGTVKALLVTVPVSLYGSTHTNEFIASAHYTYHFYRVCGNSLRNKKLPAELNLQVAFKTILFDLKINFKVI